MTNENRHRRMLRLPEVVQITGLSRQTLYRGMAEGWFPAGRLLGPRAVGWPDDVIDSWMETRPSTRPVTREKRKK